MAEKKNKSKAERKKIVIKKSKPNEIGTLFFF
jgi:hypothetical protein